MQYLYLLHVQVDDYPKLNQSYQFKVPIFIEKQKGVIL